MNTDKVQRIVERSYRAVAKANGIIFSKVKGLEMPRVRNYGVVSVIVPCYNVAPYLEKCLRSILDQDYPFIEVVVVDDGSPDNSYEIARAVAREDRRVKIVRQENQGLGGARNTGVKAAKGRFITFVDADDTISPSSYLRMAKTLDRTKSDFVVGTMQRQLGEKRWVPKWALSVHARERLRTTLEADPTVLQDVFVCNKLFRRDFWNREVGDFPERIRYEDQQPTAFAYSKSTSFDVITDIVYTWVIREDGSSITQGKANIEDLRDRLKVMSSVRKVLEKNASAKVYEYWTAKAIGFDLESYFEQVPRTSVAYWDELRRGVQELSLQVTEAAWAQVSFHNRAKAHAAMLGQREDVATILAEIQEQKRSFALSYRDETLECDADFVSKLSFDMPAQHRKAQPADIVPVLRLVSVKWTEADELEVVGAAYVRGLATHGQADIEFVIRPVGTNQDTVAAFPARPVQLEDADELSNDAYASHQEDGFTALIPRKWLERAAMHAGSQWQVEIALKYRSINILEPFNSRSNLGNAIKISHGPLVSGIRVAPQYKPGAGLVIRAVPRRPVMSSFSISGRVVHMTFEESYFQDQGISHPHVQLWHSATRTRITATVSSSFPLSFVAELPELSERSRRLDRQYWQVQAGASEERCSYVQFAASSRDLQHERDKISTLRPDLTPNGYIRFEDQYADVVISDLSLEENQVTALVKTGDSSISGEAEWALVSTSGHRIDANVEIVDDNKLQLIFDIAKTKAGKRVSEKSGGYSLRMIDENGSYWVPISAHAVDAFPLYRASKLNHLRASRTPKAGALWLRLEPPLGWNERGSFMQRRMINEFKQSDVALRDVSLFESYGGKNCSDSPLELSKYLLAKGKGGQHFWTVKDLSVISPLGTTPVVLNSRAYHEVLATAKVLVNNNNFPYYFTKKFGQKYIQTWHGTPLKKIGNDVPGANLSISYRELMKREAEAWDVLVAQNDFAARQLPASFGYTGRVLTSGYPRNDVLRSSAAASIRKKVRDALGIPDGEQVVLYAPTWRDNKKTASNHYRLVSFLDTDELRESMNTPTTVLVRGHSNTAQGRGAVQGNSVIDVTDYPDVNDLYLACDALVTDYSSVMFDYVNTGKPILYLVPDLESYASDVRGFYLDLERIAPGPLAQSTYELSEWLNDMPRLLSEFSNRYKQFVSDFVPYDDGQSTARVAEEWPAMPAPFDE
ncbi:CDP-glycerol glycerophosphotransferase family protein [Glutamicibacter creatinolyticus]|uniref:bifunctional glycosyltransferase/CDP-glycerol:glycerophosphate glycerophosphotransferase n=1 Tax=Glutamicibacter creatinolyticus TaxID=162496 RepID=UPI0037BF8C66